MGSASREALAAARNVLDGMSSQSLLGFGRELLQAAGQLDRNPALLSGMADPAASADAKTQLIDRLFASAQEPTRQILGAVARGRWSNASELVAGVEELGIRAEASAGADLAAELISIERLIGENHELELTLGSKLGDGDSKARLVHTLFKGKVSESALAITQHIVANPRGRRVGRALLNSAKIIADQGGAELATVTVAAPLDEAKLSALRESLVKTAGRPVTLSIMIDPEVVGGVRVQIGDEIIDGSVQSRLDDLRLQLAR